MPHSYGPEFHVPDIRVVPVAALVPHERHDAARSHRLVERLRQAGSLKNPPIVATLPDAEMAGRFIVLDGANRSAAAQAAGFPHVVVQLVPYAEPFVRLTTWHHALVGLEASEIERALPEAGGISASRPSLAHARAALARRDAIAYIAQPGGETILLDGPGKLHSRNEHLNALVDLYRDRIRFYRVTRESLADVRASLPDVSALIVFPHFEPAEIVELALDGERLPAGITRHVIPWRALRLNVPLDLLEDRTRSLAEKERWLTEWIAERVEENRVRFYEESTVLFDE